jgi:hypothetical protein
MRCVGTSTTYAETHTGMDITGVEVLAIGMAAAS